jgi:2-oxoglutarate ferredoxin oxidoreductase subunit alpha
LKEGVLEKLNLALQRKYKLIRGKEERYEGIFLDDAKIILVAYGSMARIARSAVHKLRKAGKKAGLVRPITLWPFPDKIFQRLTANNKRLKFLTVEMSYGQMLEDVKLAVEGRARVEFLGRAGGGMPTEEEIIAHAKNI